MQKPLKVVGQLPGLIWNSEGLYEGDLTNYFKILVTKAQNLHNPYHNFRHVMHVVWLCNCACRFYKEALSRREMRNLVVAALFHDFDHPGIMGNDDLNVERSVRNFHKYALPADREFEADIVAIIRATEFPYRCPTEDLPLVCQIIRDADMGQCFSTAWIQQVIFGLSREWGTSVLQSLEGQVKFLQSLRFYSDWGSSTFLQSDIEAKVQEVKDLILLFE